MSRSIRCAFLMCGALLLAGPADAQEKLYRWTAPDGSVHVGPNPPPRSGAVEWAAEGQGGVQLVPVEPVAPTSARAEPAARAPAPPPASPRRGAEPGDAPTLDAECAKHAGLLSALSNARRQVENLEQQLELLDEDPVAASRTECSTSKYGCRPSGYDRDDEQRRARDQHGRAELRVAELEEKLRRLGAPQRCERELD